LDEQSDESVDAAGCSRLLSGSEVAVLTDGHWLSAAVDSPDPVSVSITDLTLSHLTAAADNI